MGTIGVLSWPVLGVVVLFQSRSLVALRHPDPDAACFEGLHRRLRSPLGPLLLPGPCATQGTEGLCLDDRERRADRGARRGWGS